MITCVPLRPLAVNRRWPTIKGKLEAKTSTQSVVACAEFGGLSLPNIASQPAK